MSIIGNNNIGVYSALTAVKPGSSEEPVQILWNTICASIFPPAEGYKFAVKGPVLMDDTRPDIVVFEIKRTVVVPTAETAGSVILQEYPIMMIECKAPCKDTPTGWQVTTEGQLGNYLENIINPTNKIFAATAIGSKVQFFQWSRPNITPLHPTPFDLLHESQRAQAEQVLLHIKQGAWNFVS
ncbi:hypothetical protein FQN52_003951 [Onygenales sp. PD_12]|nr:hypothetical protein FQN51_003762 [Onygenales sp. PD_10]KAK2792183.1 hypothetical protein FQN52_003951 [Onygenales sp. PD_12]